MTERDAGSRRFFAWLRTPLSAAVPAVGFLLLSGLLNRTFMGPGRLALLTVSFALWAVCLLGLVRRTVLARRAADGRGARRAAVLALCALLALGAQGLLAGTQLRRGTLADFLDPEYAGRSLEYVGVRIGEQSYSLEGEDARALERALLSLPVRTYGSAPRWVGTEPMVSVSYAGNPYTPGEPYQQEHFHWYLGETGGGILLLNDGHVEKSRHLAVEADWMALLKPYLAR